MGPHIVATSFRWTVPDPHVGFSVNIDGIIHRIELTLPEAASCIAELRRTMQEAAMAVRLRGTGTLPAVCFEQEKL